ncbi:UNC93-like protein MFSD11-like [Nesidiocoris tenuis]|uniref:UNC93-like protein MFSD11 n=1 Tax=Nesidiocoris tenuis TaxID=355587 RepID=A0ABN7A8P8_9HEMI|nr:UNC93-like protein MFSD11-like [Nesidiocoris tenuis]
MRGFKLGGQVFNTVHVGLAFFTIFSADFTITNLQKLINVSIHEDNPDYNVDGYVSLGLIYTFYAIFLLAAPSIISFTGPRVAMTIGFTMMTIFMALFRFENTWLTYLGIFMTGTGGSLMWVGQGNYVVLNSEPETASTHFSLFWAVFTLSMMSGNFYTVFAFNGKTRIDYETRHQLLYVCSGIGVAAIIIVALLRPPQGKVQLQAVRESPSHALKRTFSLLISKDIAILVATFAFTGFQQSFGWGVYGSAIGFTNRFGTIATQLVPIVAIVYGAGDSAGSAIHIFAPKFGYHWTRSYVYWVGYAIHVLALIGIYVNIPDQAVFGYTNDVSVFETPKIWLAVLCSLVLGVSDGFYNTQLYTLLANLSPEHSAQTMALFKFIKSMSVAAFFFASTALSLHYQCILIGTCGFLGSVCFSIIDRNVYRKTSVKDKQLEVLA